MKKFKVFSLLAIILSAFVFPSCTEDDATKILLVGTWKIQKTVYQVTEYGDAREPEVLDVSQYTFVNQFKADGSYEWNMLEVNPDGMITDSKNLLFGIWTYEDGNFTLIDQYGDSKFVIKKLDETDLVIEQTITEEDGNVVKTYTQYMTRLTPIFVEE